MSDPNGLKWSKCPNCKESGIHEDSIRCYYCKTEYCPHCHDFTVQNDVCKKCKTTYDDGREVFYSNKNEKDCSWID